MGEFLPIAVRAYTEGSRPARPAKTRPRSARAVRRWRAPERVLVFDCESETGAGQTLTFGSYRYCRFDEGSLELVEEGLFHADDLAVRDPDGFAALVSYAREKELPLHPRRVFVDRVLWRCAYRARAWVVGFNLPFDLVRLAVAFGEGRGRYAGGHSLVLWDYEASDGRRLEDRYRPRVLIKSIDSKRAFISFSQRRDPDPNDQIPDEEDLRQPGEAYCFRGHFLDLRTLAFALTNESHSLDSACRLFGVEDGKLEAAGHGVISDAYVDYNRQDVRATANLFEKLIAEYQRHPIALRPTKVYSPASIAKAYLRAMGVAKPLDRQPDFPRELLGQAMVAFYGGRTECRIRRAHMPVVYVDFLSMYPTVNTLMGSWQLITAEKVEPVDVTDNVRELLERVTLEDCFTPGFWPQLLTLVQIDPVGDILPARADYGENGQWQIGLNPLTTDTPLWYSLADVVAAKLLGEGRTPRIIRAIRLVAVGEQRGLRPVQLGGEIVIDPSADDFFSTVIEQRRRVNGRVDLAPVQRERLRTFLKVLANSGCYGIFAEINRQELRSRRQDITIYGLTDPFTQRLGTVEEPGEYSFPPLAACITGAARLMLALLERLVRDAGGSYVFCDTDSMAIVATPDGTPTQDGADTTGAPFRVLSHSEVDRIIDRFTALNPYDRELVPGSILELEEWNFDPQTGERRQLYCHAVSAKRYALYNLDPDGTPILRKPSEHGLGHLMNPIDTGFENRDLAWQVWQEIVEDALSVGRARP